MITVAEATHIITSFEHFFPSETISLTEADGRVLHEPVNADRDFPPFDRVTMDGIAIAYASFEAGQREFPIQSTQRAGMPQQTLDQPSHCIQVMTGAMLPIGTDTVIRFEDLNTDEGVARITVDSLRHQQNVHHQGLDRKMGTNIIPTGIQMHSPEIAVAASVGMSQIRVSKRPNIAIISTGDELVPVENQPLPHQIRRSNGYQVAASLKPWAESCDLFHLVDDKALIKAELARILHTYDVLVLSGGVSMGKADFIPQAMHELGVQKQFHKILQRPGKPLWFGIWEANTPVFALPGNPVSTFVGCIRYVLPWIKQASRLAVAPPVMAQLSEAVTFKPDLTYFLQVQAQTNDEGILVAKPFHGHGSGDFANLIYANAFMELPTGKRLFEAGEVYPVHRFR